MNSPKTNNPILRPLDSCHLCDGKGRGKFGDYGELEDCINCRGSGHAAHHLPCKCIGIPALGIITGYSCEDHWAWYPDAKIEITPGPEHMWRVMERRNKYTKPIGTWLNANEVKPTAAAAETFQPRVKKTFKTIGASPT